MRRYRGITEVNPNRNAETCQASGSLSDWTMVFTPGGEARRRMKADVEELCSALPGVRVLNGDFTVMKVTLSLGSGRYVDMKIELPSTYPREAPLLTLDYFVECGFSESSGKINHALLSNWSADSNLAVVICAVVDDVCSCAAQATSVMNQPIHSPPVAEGQVPQNFPLLQDLSIMELQNMLLEEESFDAFVSSTDFGRNLHTNLERCIQCNIQLAQDNQSKEAAIVDLKGQISVIRSSEYSEAKEKYDKLVARFLEVSDKLDPRSLTQMVENAMLELDEQSDALEGRLVSGDISAEKFIPEFLSMRKSLHHLELAQGSAQSEGVIGLNLSDGKGA